MGVRGGARLLGGGRLHLLRVSHLLPDHPEVRLAEAQPCPGRRGQRRAPRGLHGPRHGAVRHPPPRSCGGALVRQAEEVTPPPFHFQARISLLPTILCGGDASAKITAPRVHTQGMADGARVPDRAVAAQARGRLHSRGYLRRRQVELAEGKVELPVLLVSVMVEGVRGRAQAPAGISWKDSAAYESLGSQKHPNKPLKGRQRSLTAPLCLHLEDSSPVLFFFRELNGPKQA